MGKVDENKRLKLTAMLDTAFQLFTDKGIAKTSISDIAERSGVAKGTFYLYFKDKYDIRNKLVAYQSSRVLKNAYLALCAQHMDKLEDKMVFMVDHVLEELARRPDLLGLISKNLSWGILKKEIARPVLEDDFDFPQVFHKLAWEYGISQKQSEIMLYLIVELVSSSCYSAILYQDPCPIDELTPHLFQAVRQIVRQFEYPESAKM